MATPGSTVQKQEFLKCIYISSDLHKRIKVAAASGGQSIRGYVESALTQVLDGRTDRKKRS